MDAVFSSWRESGLVWLPERGMGHYPVEGSPYDEAYFRKYQEYAATELGRTLTLGRLAIIDRYGLDLGPVLDVGIGCGAFVDLGRKRGFLTWGYDTSSVAAEWLRHRRCWLNPYEAPVPVATFWDSLEHLPDPAGLLRRVTDWAFVSLPLFTDARHILNSKHFRKDEHRWYWTREGFLNWMREQGFECLEHSTPETLLGREDIHTFVFRRAGSSESLGDPETPSRTEDP